MLFDVHECGRPGAGTVLLSSGLGGAAGYWAPQLAALRAQYRVITYDHAGTGRNQLALPEGYTIADMADEVIGILDAADTPACHVVGHALGGLVGLDLALRHSGRLRSLTVVNGWAKVDAHTRRCFTARLTLLRHAGPAAYVAAQPIFLYPASWLAAHEAEIAAEEAHGVAGFQGEANLRRRVAALQGFDVTSRLGGISLPVLVMAARDDVLVACTQSERLAAAIPGADLQMAPWGGHSLNVTDAAGFNAGLLQFLGSDRLRHLA
jgi:aminoacrylate hydrolase